MSEKLEEKTENETQKESFAIISRGDEIVRRINIKGSSAWGVYGRLRNHYNTPGDNHNIDFHKGVKYGN